VAPAFVFPTSVTFDGTHYVAHRQVGGLWTPPAPPPLASVGSHSAIGPGWHLEVAVTDTCGRMASASQTFALSFTMRGCPNP
jgi:hypothetical protein